MARRTPEQKKLEERLEKAAALGALRERQRALLRASKLVLKAEVRETLSALSETGITGALRYVAGAFGAWRSRWASAMAAPIYSIMEDAPLDTDRGTVRLPLNDDDLVQDYVAGVAEQVAATSRSKITEVLREAQREGMSVQRTSQRLREVEPEMTAQRSTFIARNELLRASRLAAQHKAERSGLITAKTWMHSYQPNAREHHLEQDGVTVALDEKFPDGSLYPGDANSADGGFNCRCALKYQLDPKLLGGTA